MEIVNQSTPLEVSFNDYANLYWDNQLTMLKQAEAQENEKVREGFKKYRKATKEVVEKAIANCQKELDELEKKLQAICPTLVFVFSYMDEENSRLSHTTYRHLSIGDTKRNQLNPLDQMSQEEWNDKSDYEKNEWLYNESGFATNPDDFLDVLGIDINRFCKVSNADNKKLNEIYEEQVGVHLKKQKQIAEQMTPQAKEEFISNVRLAILETEIEANSSVGNKFAEINKKLAARTTNNLLNSNQNLLNGTF